MGAVAVLVMSGRQLAYLPEHFAEPYIRQGLMAPLNANILRYDVPFYMARRRGSGRNEVLQAFLHDLRSASEANAVRKVGLTDPFPVPHRTDEGPEYGNRALRDPCRPRR
jgi:hypothetical protein